MIFAIIGAALGVAAIRSARRQRRADAYIASRLVHRAPVAARGYWVGQPDTEAWYAEQARLDTIDKGE